jgi:hypothetical protein
MSTARDKNIVLTLTFVLCSLLFWGCNETGSGRRPEINADFLKSRPKGLLALLYPESAAFGSSRESVVKAVIINNGDKEIQVNLWDLGQSMLALDILDSHGNRKLTIGPSTPLQLKEMKKFMRIMKPCDQIDIDYNLNIFSPDLPPGKYSVRMVSIPSNTVHLIIRSAILPF